MPYHILFVPCFGFDSTDKLPSRGRRAIEPKGGGGYHNHSIALLQGGVRGGPLWETDFYTPPVLGGAALLPFSVPAVYKNPVP